MASRISSNNVSAEDALQLHFVDEMTER